MKALPGSLRVGAPGVRFFAAAFSVLLATAPAVAAADDNADLAQDLTNPVADLVSVPIQMNFDRNIGPADDGSKITTNVQPVIPFHVSQPARRDGLLGRVTGQRSGRLQVPVAGEPRAAQVAEETTMALTGGSCHVPYETRNGIHRAECLKYLLRSRSTAPGYSVAMAVTLAG
jgi:hypothetical protein